MYIKLLSFKSVRDKEHFEIIALYAGEIGFNELTQKLGRSTRTPYTHVHRHNDAKAEWSVLSVEELRRI